MRRETKTSFCLRQKHGLLISLRSCDVAHNIALSWHTKSHDVTYGVVYINATQICDRMCYKMEAYRRHDGGERDKDTDPSGRAGRPEVAAVGVRGRDSAAARRGVELSADRGRPGKSRHQGHGWMAPKVGPREPRPAAASCQKDRPRPCGAGYARARERGVRPAGERWVTLDGRTARASRWTTVARAGCSAASTSRRRSP